MFGKRHMFAGGVSRSSSPAEQVERGKYPSFLAVDYVEIGNNGGLVRAVSDFNDLMATTTLTQ